MDITASSSAEVIKDPAGTVRIWHPAPGIMATQCEGKLADRAAAQFEMIARRIAGDHGTVTGYHDWEAMTDYESEARVRLTSLIRGMGRQFGGANFLVKSRIVALGVQAASILVTGLVVFSERSAFERALHSAVRDRVNGASRRNP